MGEVEMESSAEVHFAQQLASNQPKIREKALKKLGKWFALKSVSEDAFSSDGMLKLWKGLFYYFWNCDKPLFQEERADIISRYIHVFKNLECSFLYIDTFFLTMAREWGTIDRYRLEKFMMLVRKFLHQCYQLLRYLKWDPEHIRGFCKVMKKTVINPSHEGAPLGLKMHICDIYMEELTLVGHEELTPDLVKMFLIPYCRMLWKCDDYSYLSDVAKNIFLYLINQDADERKFHEFPALKFDAESVQQLLLKFAKKPSLRKKNLKVIYNIVKQFEDFKNGVCLADKIFEDQSPGSKLRKRDIERAALNLIEEKEEYLNEKMKFKKQKTKQNTD